MSTPPIVSANYSSFSLTSFYNRFDSKLWTNLTGTLIDCYSTPFKLVMVALLFFGCLAYAVIAYRSNNQISATPPKAELPALPTGIEQHHVDKIVRLFAEHFKAWEHAGVTITQGYRFDFDGGPDPTKVNVRRRFLSDIGISSKQYDDLFRHLQQREIIQDFSILNDWSYGVKLHEKFILSQKNGKNSA